MKPGTTTRTCGLTLLLLFSGVAVACGGGSDSPPVEPLGVGSFSPDGALPSETELAFAVDGWGFGPVGDPCPLRLTATAGTPFALGTSATLAGLGEILTTERIEGVMDAARIRPGTEPVSARIELLLPDGTVYEIPDEFAVFAPLTYSLEVSEVEPAAADFAGGALVSVRGSGFTLHDPGVPRVYFDGLEASNVVVLSDVELTCLTPAHDPGVVDVTVTNEYDSTTLPGAFEYIAFWHWHWDYGQAFVSGVEHPHATYEFAPGFTFPWYGREADRLDVANTTLEPRDTSFQDIDGTVFWLGEIQLFGSCLGTEPEGSVIYVNQMSDRLVITYDHVAILHESGWATLQVVLHESGAFAVMWMEYSLDYGRVGINPLGSVFPSEVDWSSEPQSHGNQHLYEDFGGASAFDLVGYGLLFEPNDLGGFDTRLFSVAP